MIVPNVDRASKVFICCFSNTKTYSLILRFPNNTEKTLSLGQTVMFEGMRGAYLEVSSPLYAQAIIDDRIPCEELRLNKPDKVIRRLAVSTNLIPRHKFDDAIITAVQYGFKDIELQWEYATKYSTDAKNLEMLLRLKEIYGLDFTGHSRYLGVDPASINEEIREYSCKVHETVIDACSKLGINVLTIHTGSQSPQGYEQLAKSLDRLVDYAANRGIAIALENTGYDRPAWLLLSTEECLKLCQQTGCKLTGDLVHIWCANENPFDTLAKLLPFAANLHLADTRDDRHLHIPIGFGNLPIDEILEVIANSNYQGRVVVDAIEKGYESSLYFKQAAALRDRLLNEFA